MGLYVLVFVRTETYETESPIASLKVEILLSLVIPLILKIYNGIVT